MTQPEEWTRRYLEMSADAGRSYDRVLRRHRELLDRVAGRTLDPDAVQRGFQEYLQRQAAASTRELVEASVGLLAGLLYIEARYREAMLDGLLPADDPIPPPPRPESVDLANWFQTLASYGAVQSARSVARQQKLVERIASGEVSVAQLDQQGRTYVTAHAPKFVADVVELGLAFARQMQHSSAAMADGLYDGVLGVDFDDMSADAALVIELQGAVGATVEARVEVENSRDTLAEITCALTPFVSRATGTGVATGVVKPMRFVLAPQTSRELAVHVTLDAAVFAPGTDYFGMLRVSGAGDREMLVQLVVRAADVGDGALLSDAAAEA